MYVTCDNIECYTRNEYILPLLYSYIMLALRESVLVRHDIRLCKNRDISTDPIQVSYSSKCEDTLFMTWPKSSLQMNNAAMVLFNYLTHFKLDI